MVNSCIKVQRVVTANQAATRVSNSKNGNHKKSNSNKNHHHEDSLSGKLQGSVSGDIYVHKFSQALTIFWDDHLWARQVPE